jgi:ABC-type Fe3+ transport system permease subunit
MTDVVTTFSRTFDARRTTPIILPLVLVVVAIALVMAGPMLQVMLTAPTSRRGFVRKRGSWPTTAFLLTLPSALGLAVAGYVRAALSGDAWRRAFVGASTLVVSVAEPVLCAFTALMVAVLIVYPVRRHEGARVIAIAGLVLFCIPTAVTAIGWIRMGQALGISVAPSVAHVTRMVGLAVLGFLSAYARLPRSHEDAAYLVPLSAIRRTWTLILPAVRPSLIAVAALIAAVVFADRDVASLLLLPGESRLMLNLYLLSANAPGAAVGATALAVLAVGALTIALAAAGPAVLWRTSRE